MSNDDLRTRIAAIIESVGTIDGCCADLAAKAVIGELGLTQETDYGTTYPNVPVTDRKYTRHVTEWTAEQ